MVAGTFLPWLRTGLAERNSYRAAGLIDRLLDPPGIEGFLLRIWPGLAFASAVAIALFVVGLVRTALAFSALVAIFVGAVALTTLLLPDKTYASVIVAGPALTASGAVVVVLAVAVPVFAAVRASREPPGQGAPR